MRSPWVSAQCLEYGAPGYPLPGVFRSSSHAGCWCALYEGVAQAVTWADVTRRERAGYVNSPRFGAVVALRGISCVLFRG